MEDFEAGLKRGVGKTRRDSRLYREMVESWKKKMTRGQDSIPDSEERFGRCGE